jgi:hypothetical protein
MRLCALDELCQDIQQFFFQAIVFIHRARLGGGNVLVHWFLFLILLFFSHKNLVWVKNI